MNDTAKTSSPLAPILTDSRLAVCCGPGGVGKTTTAAAIGLRAAMNGRRVAVLTIDPAKRLADSLGLEQLSNDPQEVDLEKLRGSGDSGDSGDLGDSGDSGDSGGLWAMMLDEEQTLNDLVKEFVPDTGTLERSKDNKIFNLLTSAFHGVEQYMALEKLHDLYTSGDFDLVVLDTPPTKNALEFLETPKRAVRFFDKRVVKWLMPEDARSDGFFTRLFSAGSVVQKLLAKMFGDAFVDELVEFFGTFQYLRRGLKERAEVIDVILRDEDTSFIVITSPEPRRIKEALYFNDQLEELNQATDAFVVNRVTPEFAEQDLTGVEEADLRDLLDESEKEDFDLEELKTSLVEHYRGLVRLAERDRKSIEALGQQVGEQFLQSIPILKSDIHDLDGLLQMGEHLVQNHGGD